MPAELDPVALQAPPLRPEYTTTPAPPLPPRGQTTEADLANPARRLFMELEAELGNEIGLHRQAMSRAQQQLSRLYFEYPDLARRWAEPEKYYRYEPIYRGIDEYCHRDKEAPNG